MAHVILGSPVPPAGSPAPPQVSAAFRTTAALAGRSRTHRSQPPARRRALPSTSVNDSLEVHTQRPGTLTLFSRLRGHNQNHELPPLPLICYPGQGRTWPQELDNAEKNLAAAERGGSSWETGSCHREGRIQTYLKGIQPPDHSVPQLREGWESHRTEPSCCSPPAQH